MWSLRQLKDPEYQRERLSGGLNTVNRLRSIKSQFTIKKLDACRFPFKVYQVKHGKHPPVHTSISILNTIGNYACSFTHFIKTNQEAATKVIEIIDHVNENKKNNEALNVIHSLREIRELYWVLHGHKVKHHIKQILKEFNLDLYKDIYFFKKTGKDNTVVYEKIPLKEIEELLENEKQIDDKSSVELPAFSPY